MATFEEFMDLDIRVGRVINAEELPKARKPAYKHTIDCGPLGVKNSSAQITELYKKEVLVGKEVTLDQAQFPQCSTQKCSLQIHAYKKYFLQKEVLFQAMACSTSTAKDTNCCAAELEGS